MININYFLYIIIKKYGKFMIENMPKISPVYTELKDFTKEQRYKHWRSFKREWELLEDWTYPLKGGQDKIVIPQTFRFDGVTMPRWLHWFLSPTGIFFIPSLVHDFAYRYDYLWVETGEGELIQYKKGSGREHWDDMFKEISLELNKMCGLNAFARGILFVFGKHSWNKNRQKEIQENKPKRV